MTEGAKKPKAKKVAPEAPARPVGRPSDYSNEYPEQALKLCLLGATDKELADFFAVDERTINRWKESHDDFCQSVKEGKIQADAKVAESLFKRATGYVGKKTVTANVAGAITDIQVIDEYVGPETAAAIFWLKNRQKDKWRDRQETELSGAGGGPIKHDITLSAEESYLRMIGK